MLWKKRGRNLSKMEIKYDIKISKYMRRLIDGHPDVGPNLSDLADRVLDHLSEKRKLDTDGQVILHRFAQLEGNVEIAFIVVVTPSHGIQVFFGTESEVKTFQDNVVEACKIGNSGKAI